MMFDVIAAVLAVLYTVRKLDAQRQEPEDYPAVPREQFLAWRAREVRAHTLGSTACFVKAITGAGEYVFAGRLVEASLARGVAWLPYAISITLFVAWLVAMVVALWLSRQARLERVRLGIELAPRAPEPRDDDDAA